MEMHFPRATFAWETKDGGYIYDLDPMASEIWAIWSPHKIEDPRTIDPDWLPEGCRWLDGSEWEDYEHFGKPQVYED